VFPWSLSGAPLARISPPRLTLCAPFVGETGARHVKLPFEKAFAWVQAGKTSWAV